MASIITRCWDKGWINPPHHLKNNVILECLTGSVSYGMHNDLSDMDIVSIAIPRKVEIFPHLDGFIPNFGEAPQPFTVYQKHHIDDKEKQRQYDVTIYSIVKFFHLAMQNNPNIVDILATPRRCVLASNEIGENILRNRKMFYHKGAFFKYTGYAASQLSKIRTKNKPTNSRRQELIELYGYDVKYMAHLVRICLQCRQLLIEGDLDLERNSEILKAIRRGEWTLDQGVEWFANIQKDLDTLYTTSALPHEPNEQAIKTLLLECLEHHYGSLETAINLNPEMSSMLSDFKAIIDRYETKLGAVR